MTSTADNSWAIAERTAFEKMLEVTGSEDGKHAFIGFLPAVPDVWTFASGGGTKGVESMWVEEKQSIWTEGTLEGQFTNRAAAQAFATQIVLKAQPLTAGNVCLFRVQGFPPITFELVDLANREKPVGLWIVRIKFDLVFSVLPDTP